MDKHSQKKGWVYPELMVIVRSQPEEAVLAGCKHNTLGVFGNPNTVVTGCGLNETCGSNCDTPSRS